MMTDNEVLAAMNARCVSVEYVSLHSHWQASHPNVLARPACGRTVQEAVTRLLLERNTVVPEGIEPSTVRL